MSKKLYFSPLPFTYFTGSPFEHPCQTSIIKHPINQIDLKFDPDLVINHRLNCHGSNLSVEIIKMDGFSSSCLTCFCSVIHLHLVAFHLQQSYNTTVTCKYPSGQNNSDQNLNQDQDVNSNRCNTLIQSLFQSQKWL